MALFFSCKLPGPSANSLTRGESPPKLVLAPGCRIANVRALQTPLLEAEPQELWGQKDAWVADGMKYL